MNLLAHAGLSDPSTTFEKVVLLLSLLWIPITFVLVGGLILVIAGLQLTLLNRRSRKRRLSEKLR